MIEYLDGDLLDAFDKGDVNTVLHVTNCQKKMGSGIALQIKKRYPEAYTAYLSDEGEVLGGVTESCEIGAFGDKTVFNLSAQRFYGRGRHRYLNYGALADCFKQVAGKMCDQDPIVIGIPYLMGCDRAGGDWEIVLEVVEHFFRGS